MQSDVYGEYHVYSVWFVFDGGQSPVVARVDATPDRWYNSSLDELHNHVPNPTVVVVDPIEVATIRLIP
jgi:hypothetical protein